MLKSKDFKKILMSKNTIFGFCVCLDEVKTYFVWRAPTGCQRITNISLQQVQVEILTCETVACLLSADTQQKIAFIFGLSIDEYR